MKASRDGVAFYTMQNGKGGRLFQRAGEEYFLKNGNKKTGRRRSLAPVLI
jgi:hypothetical protein